MFKKILILFFLISFSTLKAVSIKNNPYNLYNGNIKIKIDKAPIFKDFTIKNIKYKIPYVKGLDYNQNEGSPQLPVKYFLIAKPTDSSINITVNYSNPVIIKDILLAPVQKPIPDCYDCKNETIEADYEIYSSSKEYPENDYKISDTKIIRKIGIAQLTVFPFKYIPSEKKLIYYENVSINYSISGQITVPKRYKSKAILSYLQHICLNGRYLDDNIFYNENIRDDTKGRFIFIYDSFYTTSSIIQNYRQRAQQMGFSVQTKDLFNIATNDDAIVDSIMTYLQNAYDNWQEPPEYVSLIGDVKSDAYTIIPTQYKTVQEGNPDSLKIAADIYYACLDGDDMIPDLSVSRILSDSYIQTRNYMQRLSDYEKRYSENLSYYNTFTAAAYFQDEDVNNTADRRFAQTAEEVSTLFEDKLNKNVNRIYYALVDSGVNPTYWHDGTEIPDYLKIENGFSWQYNTNEVTNAIENGTFLILHRDHGNSHGWGAPSFYYNDVLALDFTGYSPVVLSFNCSSGLFDNEIALSVTDDSHYFCQNWMNSSKGTVGFIGSSRTSYSGLNDYFSEAVINFLTDFAWDDGYASIGNDFDEFSPSSFNTATKRLSDALNYAKLYILAHFDINNSHTRYCIEEFNMFGDPLFQVWTSQPEQLVITDESQLDLTSTTYSFSCNQTNYNATLYDFSGNLYGENENSFYTCTIHITNSLVNVDSLLFTVYKENYLTYQETIYVNQYVELNGTIDGSLQPITYYVTDNLTVNSGRTLTISNGCILKFAPETQLKVKGTLIVQNGSNYSYFTSVNDDSIGEKIKESNSTPQAGDWDKVYFYNTYAQADTSQITRLKIRYATNSIKLFKSNVKIDNCDFSNSLQEEIYCDGYSWQKSDLKIQDSFIRNGIKGIYLNYTLADIQNTTFDYNNQIALDCKNSELTFISNTITNTVYPIQLTGAISIESFSNNTFNENTYDNAILLNSSGAILNGVLPGYEVLGNNLAYLVKTSITAYNLSINSGAILKFCENTSFTKSNVGNIAINSSQEHPVIFTSYKDDYYNGDTNGDGDSTPSSGDWTYFRLSNNADDSLYIQNLELYYSENGLKIESGETTINTFSSNHNSNYSLYANNAYINIIEANISNTEKGIYANNSDLILQNINIGNCEVAIYLDKSSIDISNSTISQNTYSIYVNGYFILTSESNNNVSSNINNGIFYNSSGVFGTIYSSQALGSLPNTNYFPNGLTVSYNDTLTIQSGAIIKVGENQNINVPQGSVLIAEGQSENMIEFSSIDNERIDKKTSNNKTRSFWNGINFNSDEQDSISTLHYLSIRNATTAINISDRPVNISHCNIQHCSEKGIYVNNYNGEILNTQLSNCNYGIYLNSSQAEIYNCDIVNNNYGIYSNNSNSSIVCGSDSTKFNRIYNNFFYGLYNATPTSNIDARYNWWGSYFGPTHSSNPNGDGDNVSNGVLFNPWKGGSGIIGSPLSPENITIQIVGNDVLLQWDEVNRDVNGNTISVSNYKIYSSSYPYSGFSLIGESATNSFTDSNISAPLYKFYKITALSDSKTK